jgi:hypothetical protein
MKTTSAHGNRYSTPLIVFIVAVLALGLAGRAMASDNSASLASQYATWAGSKGNADALVQGLRSGSSITISTVRADGTTSLAGFTPRASMTPAEVGAALQRARASLSRLGIDKPSAEQIQAALIGGEVELRDGATTMVNGSVGVAAPPPATRRVAATTR